MDSPEKLDRTWLCSVLFMDVVSYSTRSVQLQAKLKERFNDYLARAIRDVAENDRVVLDTGDGAAVCFLAAPEVAMFTALKLRNSFVYDTLEYDPSLKVRMGINLGPVKLMRDINGNLNAIGEGINTGQRVMSFADANTILVSRSFFEVVSCLSNDYEQLFRCEGVKRDKHVREHLVYQLVPPGQEGTGSPVPQAQPEVPAAASVEVPAEVEEPPGFDPETISALRALLAPLVGPIAGHLVKRAAALAPDAAGLVQEIAGQVQDPVARARFAAQASRVAGIKAQPALETPAAATAAPDAIPVWDPVWIEKARMLLAAQIGPMARILVDRTAKRARSREELCQALSAELSPDQRERFLMALGEK